MKKVYALIIFALLVFACIIVFSVTGNNGKQNMTPADTEEHVTESDTTASDVLFESETAENEITTAPETTEAPPPEPEPHYPSGMYTQDQLEAMDNTKNGYGQGLSVDENNRPWGALNAQNTYGQYGGMFISDPDGNIYLTFDLGYENGYTGKILDILSEYGVHATFFATMDYCRAQPELVARIINEGHTLGNHSVSHKSMPTLTVSEMENEITGLHDYIKSNYNYEMHLFRPPMGEYSVRSLSTAQNLGYKTVNWSFAYYDYDTANQPDPDAAFERVTGAAHSGAIYLLHARSKTNTQILPKVIEALQNEGYKLSALS